MKNQPFHVRLRFAISGIALGLRSERSLRSHAISLCAVMIVLIVRRPSAVWWALASLAGFSVLAAELFNTAIERLADHLHPGQHHAIQVLKDCSAGAVLLAALGSLGVAMAFVASELT